MSRIQAWILFLAFLAFSAGMVFGAFLSQRVSPLTGPFAQYEANFIRTFNPSEEQLEVLREILVAYQQLEIREKNRYFHLVEPGLRKIGQSIEVEVTGILNQEQKKKYSLLSRSEKELFPFKNQ